MANPAPAELAVIARAHALQAAGQRWRCRLGLIVFTLTVDALILDAVAAFGWAPLAWASAASVVALLACGVALLVCPALLADRP